MAVNSVCLSAFRFFDCIPLDGATSVVATQPAVSCNSDGYAATRPAVIALIVLLIGVAPLALLAALLFATRRGWLEQEKFRRRFGIL